MKAKTSADAKKLEDIPNIGKSMANDLRLMDVFEPKQLIGKDPYALYDRIGEIMGVRNDPCVCDTMIAAVRFMEGSAALPWWHYTAERKKHFR
jgi:hypothetical protein